MFYDKKPTLDIIKILDMCYDKYENGEVEDLDDIEEFENITREYNLTDEIFEENNKKGLKDASGKIIIPPIFDDINDTSFYRSDRPMIVTKDGKLRLVARDGKGTALTKFEFVDIEWLYCLDYRLFSVSKEDTPNRYAIFAGTKFITPFEIEHVYQGVKANVVMLYTDNKVGLLDGISWVYVRPVYDEIIDHGSGYYFIFVKDGINGLINKHGEFIEEKDFIAMSTEEKIR